MSHILQRHHDNRILSTLVENRTVYSSENSELSIFETHQVAEKVSLTFNYPVIATMLTGKKVMHLKGMPAFDFLPGESVVMPAEKEMVIDFPIATLDSPTQCLALAIDPTKILETINEFEGIVTIGNEQKLELDFDVSSSHLNHNKDIDYLIGRLLTTFTNNSKSKDILVDLMIKELIVRLLQTKAKQTILTGAGDLFNNNRIAHIVKYIREHITEQISVDKLAGRACMSVSHFHKIFKNTLGESPIDYINFERIKFAKKLMANTNKKLSEIAFLSGFNNVSYFNRQFKKHEMISPSQFRKILNGGITLNYNNEI